MSTSPVFETASSRNATVDSGDRFFPRAPKSVVELGISQNILVDLMLKLTLLEGATTLGRLSGFMKVSSAICDVVFHHLRKEQYVEVKGMKGNDYEFE